MSKKETIKITDCNVFPDKITREKVLEWYKKLEKEREFYEFQHANKPSKGKKKTPSK